MKKQVFFIWFVILFVSTSLPRNVIPQITFWSYDKIWHLFMYSVLVLFFLYSFDRKEWKYFFIIALIAAIDEIHQYFIPGRAMSFIDFGVDVLGGGLTFWILKS